MVCVGEGRRSAVAVLLALMPVAFTACNGSTPAKSEAAASPASPPSAASSVAAADPLQKMVPAPGSERFAPDEHPEQADLSSLTVDSLASGIANYVADESKRHGGTFPVPSPETGAPMNLVLSEVHKERLSRLADGRFFACADFKSDKGDTYDVDVFMQPHSTSGVVPTDIIVHKVNGEPLFNWNVRDGVWSAVPVAPR